MVDSILMQNELLGVRNVSQRKLSNAIMSTLLGWDKAQGD